MKSFELIPAIKRLSNAVLITVILNFVMITQPVHSFESSAQQPKPETQPNQIAGAVLSFCGQHPLSDFFEILRDHTVTDSAGNELQLYSGFDVLCSLVYLNEQSFFSTTYMVYSGRNKANNEPVAFLQNPYTGNWETLPAFLLYCKSNGITEQNLIDMFGTN